MLRFFSSLQRIEQHIASLNHHHTTACPVCHQTQQWVSHGYLYKTSTQQQVGKRILCSRRYGKSGCGHSQSLYLACVIPQRRYPLSVLLAFVRALITGQTVEHAYFHAIGHAHSSPRQAWRWLNRLWNNMGQWRCWLLTVESTERTVQHRSRRLTLLLSTLHQCLVQVSPALSIQHVMQCRFC